MNWNSCSYTYQGQKIPQLTCIPVLVKTLVYWGVVFAGVVAVFMIIFSGYRFMTSGGDPKGVEDARKTATYAIIGLILVFLSFFIVRTIGTITGVDAACINGIGFDSCN